MMKICIAGKNEIAVHGLKLAIGLVGRESVAVCCNRTDDGRSGWQPSLRRHAREQGIQEWTLPDAEASENVVFLSLEFDRLIRPKRFLSRHLYNIHFSLLPKYKGMYTSAWPILNGEASSGVTLHRIDPGIDTGDVIQQSEFALEASETARSLYFKYLDESKKLLDDAFERLISGDFVAAPQSPLGSTYYSSGSISYSNIGLDLKQTACGIDRQIRAFSFREYQLPEVDCMFVGKTHILRTKSTAPAGSVLVRTESSRTLATIDYDMVLERDCSLDIHAMLDSGDAQGIKDYLELSSMVDIKNRNGWTPLMRAAYLGETELCNLLIAAGADTNARNANGTSVLMYAKDYAVQSCDFSICDTLIERGARPEAVDAFGRNVADYCVRAGQEDAVKYFAEACTSKI